MDRKNKTTDWNVNKNHTKKKVRETDKRKGQVMKLKGDRQKNTNSKNLYKGMDKSINRLIDWKDLQVDRCT